MDCSVDTAIEELITPLSPLAFIGKVAHIFRIQNLILYISLYRSELSRSISHYSKVKMPHSTASTIEFIPLHPTIAAEVRGVNFENISDEDFSQLRDGIAKVKRRDYVTPDTRLTGHSMVS
jgi:hypothetical protein